MIIIQNPPEICNAYNDIIIEFTAEEGDGTTAEIDVKYKPETPDEEVYVLSREFFNDVARFNLSHLVKKLFRNSTEDLELEVNTHPFYVDRNIFVEPWIEYYEDGNISCLNSVAQSGAPFLIGENNVFLAKAERLKKYVDYPLSVSFLKNSSLFGYCFFNHAAVKSGGVS